MGPEQQEYIFGDIIRSISSVRHRGSGNSTVDFFFQNGINGHAHPLINSNLNGRAQCVLIDGSYSEDKSIETGVPQRIVPKIDLRAIAFHSMITLIEVSNQ